MTDSQKTKRAIGLKYAGGDKKNAPKVVAKGYGDLAEAIIAMAEETGILIGFALAVLLPPLLTTSLSP